MAYKRELIINNGSLTSYKKLLKVSDVCQLLDKSKYSATQTINGVTFTNNGDGTITYNGVTSVGANYTLQSGLKVVSGHKYFSCVGENMGDKISVLLYTNEDTYNTFDNRFPNADGEIVTALKNSDELYYQPKPRHNISFSNFVLKPQLFDLTEMYGAGNEPKTVAEFKAKFPNEMYDYSPRCWVTSYKTGLIAKTKNLFDKSKAIKGRAIRYIDGGEYDDAPYYASDYINVSGISTLTITPTHEIPSVCFYDKNKTFISSTRTMIGVSVPSNAVYIRFDNKLTNLGTCQLEKGTTATDYVPYGYL